MAMTVNNKQRECAADDEDIDKEGEGSKEDGNGDKGGG